MPTLVRRLRWFAVVAAAALASLGVGVAPVTDSVGEPAGARSLAQRSATSAGDTIRGRFDVGGHRLYLECAGTGSPTVVYLHGAVFDRGIDPHVNGLHVSEHLQDDYRVCVYDRRNVGHSDTVDAVQRPVDAVRDLENLLDAADVEPPYVLLGASFGGLLADLYANLHPDDVVGMVLLDAAFPDDLALDPLLPRRDRYRTAHRDDMNNSLERISHYAAHRAAYRFAGREPDIPVTYLASSLEPRNTLGDREYDGLVQHALAAYVDRFSPGKMVWVASPHFMEPAVPEQIARAVRDVIDEAD